MSDQNKLQSALNSAYFYLKFRPRTKKEVERNLQKKSQKYGWSDETIQQALTYLEEQKLINDREFIQLYVESRIKIKPKSTYALRNELTKAGIAKELLDEYFAEHEQNEEALAYEALKNRWPRYGHLDKKTRFQKAASFLTNRGFSFDTIKKTIAKYDETEYNKGDY